MKYPVLCIIFFSMVGSWARADDFLGADTVLQRLAERAKAKPEAEVKADPIDELAKRIKAFDKDGQTLPAETAAAQWLSLYDTFVSIPQAVLYRSNNGNGPSMQEVMKALPPSSAWQALAGAINKRPDGEGKALRDSGLRLLASVLHGDGGARRKAVEALKHAIADDKGLEEDQKERLQETAGQMADFLDLFSGTDAERIAAFEKRLAALETQDQSRHNRYGGGLQVPDLVRLAGQEKASALLLRALIITDGPLKTEGKATRRLAVETALKNVKKLKQACWDLVETMDDLPLYEALARQFPKTTDPGSKRNADEVYLLALIATDRVKDASAFVTGSLARDPDNAVTFSIHDLESMQQQGLGRRVLAFLHDMIQRDFSSVLWRPYIELSAREGASAEALALLQEALKKPLSGAKQKLEIQTYYADALLAANHVDEGVAILREVLKAGPQAGAVDAEAKAVEIKKQWAQLGVQITPEMLQSLENRSFGMASSGRAEHLSLCRRLMSLGQLLQRPELIGEAVKTAVADCASISKKEEASSNSDVLSVAGMLRDLKRLPEAETLLVNDLLVLAAPPLEGEPRYGGGAVDALTLLAMVYVDAGRAADAVTLFDKSPLWAMPDLSALSSSLNGETPLILTAARALAQVNRKDEARKLALSVVQDYPGKDSGYELLLSLGTDGLETQMDEIYKGDRFEERPLIWKARLQFLAGRLDEAEKTVRAAIAVDPSDGEQGKGDRMRAYAVLGDILEKKGDADQAKIMRGAVAAIRVSETADDWWQAGLLSRAVKMYEEALNHFADAYCIQSRLALRYSEMGDSEKAAQYYRRAFELMPDSFGRVESHCFGCEGAFAGEHAQGIADKVFTELAFKLPDRPQVFYLLGYLREAQGRAEEAATQYRKAVTLDPDYLNAWNKLQGLGDSANQPAEERERIELSLFRIDPLGHHSHPSLDKLSNLGGVWDAILAAERARPERPVGPLYPLAAAAAELDQTAVQQGQRFRVRGDFFERREQVRDLFVGHPLIRYMSQYLETVNQSR